MLLQDEIAQKIESQEMIFNEDAVGEALQIEEVLNRAYEIRRARGGLFGYDLEDWLEANENWPRDIERSGSKIKGQHWRSHCPEIKRG